MSAIIDRVGKYEIVRELGEPPKPRWTGPKGGWGYSSPHLATIAGVPQIVLLNGAGAIAVTPTDGLPLWTHEWKSDAIVQPVVLAGGDGPDPLAGKPYIVPEDLAKETLITYPVERERLDIFTRFLEPADVEPAQIRTAEMTMMMMQLVASGRGVCCLPNWALHEYSSRGYVTAKRLGEKSLYATLYAGIRSDMLDAPFMRDFLLTAKDTAGLDYRVPPDNGVVSPVASEDEEVDDDEGAVDSLPRHRDASAVMIGRKLPPPIGWLNTIAVFARPSVIDTCSRPASRS